MDKNYQYYNNREKYINNLCIPKREEIIKYLIKENFLSEFSTEEEKQKVLDNLGILQKLQQLRLLLNEKISQQILDNYIKKSELKTINNNSLIGEGNIEVYGEKPTTSTEDINELRQKILEYKDQQDYLNNKLEELSLKHKYKHKIISQARYEALQKYDKNTIYLVTESLDEASGFGDIFPFVLGKNEDSTQFGETFPFILD